MATILLGIAGAGVGAMFGNPALGWSAGTLLAGVLFPPKQQLQERGKISDARVSGSSYGAFIPQVYGQGRVGGNIIWMTPIRETSHNVSVGGGKNFGHKQTLREYSYNVSMAALFCKGPVVNIRRIWADDKLIYDQRISPPTKYTIRPYLGTETQPVDPLISSFQAAIKTPAYRGLCYAVFDDLLLDNFGKRIPIISAEIACPVTGSPILDNPDIQAFWPFDSDATHGTLDDYSGGGYNLSPLPEFHMGANPIIGVMRAGVQTSAFSFQGDWTNPSTGTHYNYTDLVAETSSVGTSGGNTKFLASNGGLSAGFWIKCLATPPNPPLGANYFFTLSFSGGSGVSWQISIEPAFPPANIRIKAGNTIPQNANGLGEWFTDFDLLNPNINLRPWHYIIWTYRKPEGATLGRSRIYVDGSMAHEVFTNYDVAQVGDANSKLHLAQTLGPIAPHENGYAVDEVFVASVELSPTDVLDLYHVYKPTGGPPPP